MPSIDYYVFDQRGYCAGHVGGYASGLVNYEGRKKDCEWVEGSEGRLDGVCGWEWGEEG